MKTKSTTVILALAAIFVLSAITTASASAALPEFKPVPTKKKFTSTSGSVYSDWNNGTEVWKCSKSTASGEITSATVLGKVVIKFTGCEATNTQNEKCSLKSPSGGAGEIVTGALKGELGTIKGGSGVGLLLGPESKKTVMSIEASCITGGAVTGDVAGEMQVIGKKQATNKLAFATSAGKDSITEITLDSGTKEKPSLKLGGGEGTFEAADSLTFEEALEVT